MIEKTCDCGKLITAYSEKQWQWQFDKHIESKIHKAIIKSKEE